MEQRQAATKALALPYKRGPRTAIKDLNQLVDFTSVCRRDGQLDAIY
jgi:hypothetical protein